MITSTVEPSMGTVYSISCRETAKVQFVHANWVTIDFQFICSLREIATFFDAVVTVLR